MLLLAILCALVVTSDCRGGFRSGGSSYRPSAPAPRPYSAPSRPSYPTQQRPQSTSGSGWTRPQTPPARPLSPESNGASSQTGTGQKFAGWQTSRPPTISKPVSNSIPSAPQLPSNSGWKTSASQTPAVPNKALPYAPATNTNSGWKAPAQTSVPNKSQPPASPATNPNYGWKTPTQISAVTTRRPPSYHQGTPHLQNSPNLNRNHNNNQNQNPYNTGKKYEKGYSKGYDQGYQRGVQQATRVNPVYYPQQSHFGYPGQGINAGYGSPTYQGMAIHGTPNNYGYPVSSAYGYQSYGSGNNHDFRNGVLLGVAGGYLLNSALHPTRHVSMFGGPSVFGNHHDSWGYAGSGYGSDYRYTKTETNTVINNYFNNTPPPSKTESGDENPSNWVQCVAYDPMTAMTLTNPNCTCSVTVETMDNSTVAHHNCSTIWGHRVTERTPVGDAEVFDVSIATAKAGNPEKLRDLDIQRRRMEAFKLLEMIVTMGSFTS